MDSAGSVNRLDGPLQLIREIRAICGLIPPLCSLCPLWLKLILKGNALELV